MVDLLRAIPPEAYVALFTAIITATVTLVAVDLSNKANSQRLLLQLEHERDARRSEILRDRLEELYTLSEKWASALYNHYLPYLGVMKGELTYNQALDLDIAHGKDAPDFHRLEMLIDMYYPQVRDALEALFRLQGRANDILARHKQEYERGETDGTDFADPLFDALHEIDKAGQTLRARLRDQIRLA